MSGLDERAIVRLMEVAEERDLAFVQVRMGRSEVTIARVPPSELEVGGLFAPARAGVEEHAGSAPIHSPSPPGPLAAEAPSQPETAPFGAATPALGAGETIDAPMVGAFYRAPGPDQPPFVEVGSAIEIGDTVGLVEAMKVFTAVPATRAGVVVELFVENGAFVEFGQPLMRVEAPMPGTGQGTAPHG